MDGFSSATKLRWDIRRQEVRVAACHVCVGIINMTETVQYIHKLIHQLHLINNDVIQFFVLDSVMNIVKHSVWISQFLVHAVFKVNADDVVISHSII